MIKAAKAIASCGIGYIGKGSGSIAAAVYCLGWLFIAGYTGPVWSMVFALAILVSGTWAAGRVETAWGHDSSRVVIDEIAGMMITLAWAPISFNCALAGFVLFRFFDILKPLGIKTAEKLPGGWGVMGDDILAGIYSFALLRLLIFIAETKFPGLI